MKISHKNLIIAGIIIVAVGISVLIFISFGKTAPLRLFSVEAKNADITENINLIGQVKASQGVDLAFESQGKIVANYVKVGDKIYEGQPLLAIDSSILQSQLKQAQAQLNTFDMNIVESKTNVGLQSLYNNSLSTAQKSVSTAKDILLTISDIQYNHFISQSPINITLQDAKSTAVYSLLGQPNAGLWATQSIAPLNAGAYGLVQAAINNPTEDNISSALSATQSALQDISNMVSVVPIDFSLTPSERATISQTKTNINLEIVATTANIQAIASQKINNSATITATDSQIEAAKAAVDVIKTQISKTVIRALFNGQVDKNNAVVGQIVSPNVPVITISNNNLEVDTYISEIDLSCAKIGGSANITLDAYGNNVIFPAKIVSIDSAPSIVNGISVYGARLKFENYDNRIKPGMTANITVISDTHSNILVIPKSAVIEQNNQYFVIVDKGNSQKETRQVTVGLRDSKNIEITSGLKSGEKVLAY